MPSPFPGMDPYLERHWQDVHTALIGDARRALNGMLPDGLVARAEERVAVEADGEPARQVGPDVRVFSPSTADPQEGEGGVVIEAPFKLVASTNPIVERSVRVVDEGGQLVSVVEFVSPANKRPPGLEPYREKRADLLASGVHVVEIDLVRAGNWRTLMRPEACPAEAVSTYRAVVRTAGRRPGAYLFPISLRQPLPDVPVPLRATDKPVPLPLGALVAGVYRDGRYGRTVDYRQPIEPPLESDDAIWADQMLREAGRR